MEDFLFDFKNIKVPSSQLKKNLAKILPAVEEINERLEKREYKRRLDFVNLPFDESLLKNIEKFANKIKEINPSLVIIIGIGGSNLGFMALWYALLQEKPVLFAETIEPFYIQKILNAIKEKARKKENVLVFFISKSGTTIESVANFAVIGDALKKHYKDWQKYVVAITDEGSRLMEYAQKRGIMHFPIPSCVGGRYSVLSAVGLLPAKVLGLDIKKIVQGAQKATQNALSFDLEKNYAAMNAAAVYFHYLKNRNIYNLFIFAPTLKYFGQWWRQLIAESLGKEGKGVTPLVSLGTTDLHSMFQLFFEGRDDKFTNFLFVKQLEPKLLIRNSLGIEELGEGLVGRSLQEIMEIVFRSITESYQEKGLPFSALSIKNVSEESFGFLFQLKMIENFYLGSLLKVKVFDEPAVNVYKSKIKDYLKNT